MTIADLRSPKRQPRGKEPLEQKAFKLPRRITHWIASGAMREGVTEALFLTRQLERLPDVPSAADEEVA